MDSTTTPAATTAAVNSAILSYKKILLDAWGVFLKAVTMILAICGGYTVLALALSYGYSRLLMGGSFGTLRYNYWTQSYSLASISGGGIFLFILLVLVLVIGGIVMQIVLTRLVQDTIQGKTTPWAESLEAAKKKFLPLLGTSLLMGICLAVLSIVVIPGIIFSLYWAFTSLIVILENKTGFDAMKESKRLVQGRWWNTFGFFFMLGLLSFVVMIPVMLLMAIPFLGALIYAAAMACVVSYFFVVQVVFYNHMKKTVTA